MSAPRRRNAAVAAGSVAAVLGMVGLTYASVPLYALFCRVTGFGGTPQIAAAMPDRAIDRTLRVRFTADVSRDLPWTFAPEQREMTLRLGEPGLAYYTARNDGGRPITGTAVYNVTPDKAAIYFTKVQCFCFGKQVLPAGAEAELPVYFYVDPAMADDPGMADVQVVTLSYTFFPADSGELDEAVGSYYRSVGQANAAASPAEAGTVAR